MCWNNYIFVLITSRAWIQKTKQTDSSYLIVWPRGRSHVVGWQRRDVESWSSKESHLLSASGKINTLSIFQKRHEWWDPYMLCGTLRLRDNSLERLHREGLFVALAPHLQNLFWGLSQPPLSSFLLPLLLSSLLGLRERKKWSIINVISNWIYDSQWNNVNL